MTEDPKIRQLQIYEQNLQGFLQQKQQFQQQLIEVETGLKELENSEESYKIIGNIMVRSDKEKLKGELLHKKEIIELRIKSVQKQEVQLKEKSVKLKEEVMEKMKGEQDE
jgi:prefoldin beta subunit